MNEITSDERSAPQGRPVTRRTIVKGAAWSVPVIAAAAAAPAWAVSGCQPIDVDMSAQLPSANTQVFVAQGPNGIYTVSVANSFNPATTVVGQVGQTFNMSRGNYAWAGMGYQTSMDSVQGPFGPAGALVINQRGVMNFEPDGDTPLTTPKQSFSIEFRDPNGVLFTPTNVTIEVFDISSVSGGHRYGYWDAVGFSQRPDSIDSQDNSLIYPGTGAGTLADPFHRVSNNAGTTANGHYFYEGFKFSSISGGQITMEYSSRGLGGWQFISISQISFSVVDCR